MSAQDFVRRSQLVTPAKSTALIAKALALDCDSLIIDLEDAIAPAMKVEARVILRSALQGAKVNGKELGVRINSLDSPWCLDDLLAIEGLPIDTIVVPKVNCAEDMYTYDQILRQIERRGGKQGITLLALLESARGVLNASSIALASKRCRALIFGSGDFRADTGIAFTHQGMFHARAQIVLAAAAAGLQALDHVHPAIADLEGLATAAQDGKEMGFTGKWAIHPQQVPIINTAFSPTPEEIAKARKVIAAYEAALRAGEGAITVDGVLVDEAVLKTAQRRTALADRITPKTGD